MRLEIGDIVRNGIWSYEGQITEEYNSYWDIQAVRDTFISTTPDNWLEEQIIPFTVEEVNSERWFLVGIFTGGSAWCCESKLYFIQRIELDF